MSIESVIAVVDAAAEETFVWWVHLGPREPKKSRLCGAWVVENPALLSHLLNNRIVVATNAGWDSLKRSEVSPEATLDIAGTLKTIREEIQRCEDAWVEENQGRTKSKQLPELELPRPPSQINLEGPAKISSTLRLEPKLRKVIEIAHWLDGVCAIWDRLEDERTGRKWLARQAGPERRSFPAVTS